MMAFKARLRASDLLLLDDLQFVIGKNSTQEELLHTIDELMTAGKRLVVTADRPPAMLDGVEVRRLSRLSGGLVADIAAPEEGPRERIIRQDRKRGCVGEWALARVGLGGGRGTIKKI